MDDVIDTVQHFEEREGGRVIFNAPISTVVVQQTERGNNLMEQERSEDVKSAWANGLFYLFTFAVVIAGLGFLAGSIPFYTLALVIIADILFVPLIGALQLRQDNRLSEESFVDLVKIGISQLPVIGRMQNRAYIINEPQVAGL